MFNLGELFALGKKVSINNIEEVNAKIAEERSLGYAKSFNMMINYWAQNSLFVNLKNIQPKNNNIFLICPVRNATEKEKADLHKLINLYEQSGYHVHYPERNTNQNPVVNGINTGGFNICAENAKAIAEAQTVVVFYNKQSTGSMFDLGVTYQLMQQDPKRKLILANNFEYDELNIIDQKLVHMLNMPKESEQSK